MLQQKKNIFLVADIVVHHIPGALILLQVHGDLSFFYGNNPVLFQFFDGSV